MSFAGDGTLELPTAAGAGGAILLGLPDDSLLATGSGKLSHVLPGGTVDPAYGVGGAADIGFGDVGRKALLALGADGSVFVARTGTTGDLYEWTVDVRRLNPAGRYDAAYGNGGVAKID